MSFESTKDRPPASDIEKDARHWKKLLCSKILTYVCIMSVSSWPNTQTYTVCITFSNVYLGLLRFTYITFPKIQKWMSSDEKIPRFKICLSNKGNFAMQNCMSASYETHCFVSWKKIFCSKKYFHVLFTSGPVEKRKSKSYLGIEIVSAFCRVLNMLFFPRISRIRWPKW